MAISHQHCPAGFPHAACVAVGKERNVPETLASLPIAERRKKLSV